jgi:hypothetical protein
MKDGLIDGDENASASLGASERDPTHKRRAGKSSRAIATLAPTGAPV